MCVTTFSRQYSYETNHRVQKILERFCQRRKGKEGISSPWQQSYNYYGRNFQNVGHSKQKQKTAVISGLSHMKAVYEVPNNINQMYQIVGNSF